MTDRYDKFNEKQHEAITYNGDSLLVVAGAGSGKTSVLTYRVVYLVLDLGYDPKRILGFTFTNKAANEMKTRINSLIPNASFPYIGTFHGICLRILREDIDSLNLTNIKSNFNIIDNEDQLVLLRDLYNEYKFDKSSLSYKNCLSYISKLKSNETPFEECYEELEDIITADFNNYKKNIVSVVYKRYVQYLEKNNMLDFDDLIKYTLKLLLFNQNVKIKWQNRFDYILVDEFQDTNSDQLEIIKLLSLTKDNVFAVGDPDQMIYSWRGAYDDIFNEYVDFFKNVKTVVLEKNYRSTKKILNTANKLIKNNFNRIEKNLYTESKFDGEVVYYDAPDQDTESRYVAAKIKKLLNEGYQYKDICILYRQNYVSRNIEQQLTYSSIPYHIYGGFKFFQRREVKDLISFLKVISNNDEISLSRIYNVPKRGISEATYLKLKEYAVQNNISVFEVFENADNIHFLGPKTKASVKEFYNLISYFKNKEYTTILNLLDDVIEKTKYKEMLIQNEEENRIENVDELKNAIYQFESRKPNATLDEYLQEIALLTSLDEESKENKNFVSLMTVHISKGLEFKVVFLIQFNEGVFPAQKSIDSGEIEEERRIAYVAITRAKENLYILSSGGVNFLDSRRTPKTPSRFIRELKNDDITMTVSSSRNDESVNRSIFTPVNESKVNYNDNYRTDNVEYEIGDWLMHTLFGQGMVVDVDDRTVKIAFKKKSVGTKRLLKNHKSIYRKLN